MYKTDIISIIESLRANKSTLKKLDLSYQPGQTASVTRVEMEIVADYLQYNSKLEKLDLSGNDFKDENLEYLVKRLYHNEKLKVLSLAHTQITARGLEALAALMFFNTQIVELNLEGTPAIQDKESAKSLAIVKQALMNNRARASEDCLTYAA